MNREINEISTSPELKGQLDTDGMIAVAMTPSAFAGRIKQELAEWKRIATARKIVVD